MLDFSKTCILCKTNEELNTQSVLKVEDERYQVSVCDRCEEDASPKRMRVSLTERLDVIKNLCEEANALLGTDLSLESLIRGIVAPTPVAAAPVEVGAAESPAVLRQEGGVRIMSQPIRRGGEQRGAAVTQKEVTEAKTAGTGERVQIERSKHDKIGDIEVHSEIRIFDNTAPIESKIGHEFEGHRACRACMSDPSKPQGDGVVMVNGRSVLCNACGGSGLLF